MEWCWNGVEDGGVEEGGDENDELEKGHGKGAKGEGDRVGDRALEDGGDNRCESSIASLSLHH